MHCPQCESEYRVGVLTCSDCDVELVTEQPLSLSEPRPNAQILVGNGIAVRAHRAFGNEFTVSSAMTFVMKFVYPAAWSLLVGGMVVEQIMSSTVVIVGMSTSVVVISLSWALGLALFVAVFGGIKRVRVRGRELLISNYLKECSVPFENIAGVQESMFFKDYRVTIRFYSMTDFGQSISIVPKAGPASSLYARGPRPVVAELISRVNHNQ